MQTRNFGKITACFIYFKITIVSLKFKIYGDSKDPHGVSTRVGSPSPEKEKYVVKKTGNVLLVTYLCLV